jgi:Domain of unknown function (DUF4468) with TBP-like fold
LYSLFIFFFISENLIAQNSDCKYSYVDSTSLNKIKLYKSVRVWIAKEFDDANKTIKMDDKDLSKIICKGTIPIEGRKPALAAASIDDEYVSFTLTVDIKDRKYRIVFDELFHRNSWYPSERGYVGGGDLCNDKPQKIKGSLLGNWELKDSRWQKIKEKVATVFDGIYKELKTEINKSSKDEF